jgi:hypothetical protein
VTGDRNATENPRAFGRLGRWAATVWLVVVALAYLAVRELGLRVME